MALRPRKVTAFFQNPTQMAMPYNDRIQLQSEGMSSPSNLVQFNKDDINAIIDNLSKPGGRILDPNSNASKGATTTTLPFVFSAKSQMKKSFACDLTRHDAAIGWDISATNIS